MESSTTRTDFLITSPFASDLPGLGPERRLAAADFSKSEILRTGATLRTENGRSGDISYTGKGLA